jgi:hypothetical protein
MAARDSYEPGTPSWVDLGVPDVDAAVTFYEGVFGWKIPEGPPDSGGYRMCMLRDRPVAGLGPQTEPGDETWWTTYVAVADCDATAAKVKRAGGTVVVDPMDIPNAGRMAVCRDPKGAPFSLWQAAGHAGAGYVNETGALCWNERETLDLDAVVSFYGDVFGWQAESMPGSVDSRVFKVGDAMVASVRAVPEGSESWAVYFQVDDCDATVARAGELGGKTLGDPFDVPDIGRMCEIADPQGAVFYVLSPPAAA